MTRVKTPRRSTPATKPLFVAHFDDDHALLAAVEEARAAGLRVHDVYTPYPVHGMEDAMGLAPSRLPWVTFVGGLAGLGAALYFQWWSSAVDWAINVGGKPYHSFPAFVPVAFEMTVLSAGLCTVAALFVRAGLRPRARPKLLLPGVTNDRFALALDTVDAHFDRAAAEAICERHHALETSILEVAR